MRPSPMHLLILVLVIVIIFGAAKLPMVAKNLGKSMKVFKNEVKDLREDDPKDPEAKEITDAQHTAGRTGSHAAEPAAEPHRTAETKPDDRL